MDTGLLVTELVGSAINPNSGDYSRGANGFWVSKGHICYPVKEITIAGNLKEMLPKIQMIGKDVDRRNKIKIGSVLIESMTVASS